MTIEERDAQVMQAMRRRGQLTEGAYLLLAALRALGLDAYAYWSGGERCGTPCVWAFGTRYTVEEWNALTIEGAARLMAAVRAAGAAVRGVEGGQRGENGGAPW